MCFFCHFITPIGVDYQYVTSNKQDFKKKKRDANYIKKRKFIENTVIHIQAGNQQYTITAIGIKNAFARLVAFLLDNHLLEGYRLVFFTDGADVIGCHKIFERIDSK